MGAEAAVFSGLLLFSGDERIAIIKLSHKLRAGVRRRLTRTSGHCATPPVSISCL
jgi:hypothetical protein